MTRATVLERARKLSTATVHEALSGKGEKRGHLPPRIRRIGSQNLCGTAFTVSCAAGSNINLHRALTVAAPDDILVATCEDAPDHGYWGEVMAVAAIARGIAGLVIDGGVRDTARMDELGFPVFAQGACIKGTGKTAGGALGAPLIVGETTVMPGDLVLGDADGIVIVPQAEISDAIAQSEARDRAEEEIFQALRAGRSTLDIYGFQTG